MPSTRTQIYLTDDQRRRLDARGRRTGHPMARMIREAVDAYLADDEAADVQAAGKLQATLEANLGVVLAFRSRLEGMIKVTGEFGANINAVTDIKVACIPPVVAAVGTALEDTKAAFDATVSIAGAVGAS